MARDIYYLRPYGVDKKICILDIPDDKVAAAALRFEAWAARYLPGSRPFQIEELELAFVRYYKEQWEVPSSNEVLVDQFNKAVDTLKELRDVALSAAAEGDSFGAYASELATLLVDFRSRSESIQSRVPEKARLLLGAFARRREITSKMGAPWSHARRCAHALAQAWHRAFRELPRQGSREVDAYYDLLCSILPDDEVPERALATRALRHARGSKRLGTRVRTAWD